LIVAQSIFKYIFSPVARKMIVKKPRWSYAVHGAKVNRCCEAVFKCCYYVGMTAWGFYLLRGKPWLPWVLGGSGDTRFCWTDGFPFQAMPEDLQKFYLTSVGFHLCDVVMHVMETGLPDFWEMLLHHTVSIFLVSFSYVLNYVRVGSLVLFLHGATDIFIYMSKVLVDTSNVRLMAISYFALVIAYAWFRIFAFPMYVMRSAWVESAQVAKIELWGFLNFALSVLLLLHMYWFGLIIKIGMNFKKTGEARDMVANLSSMDMAEKKAS
jgi:ceramide synthetase